jgi:hypothetical protein
MDDVTGTVDDYFGVVIGDAERQVAELAAFEVDLGERVTEAEHARLQELRLRAQRHHQRLLDLRRRVAGARREHDFEDDDFEAELIDEDEAGPGWLVL